MNTWSFALLMTFVVGCLLLAAYAGRTETSKRFDACRQPCAPDAVAWSSEDGHGGMLCHCDKVVEVGP